MGRSRKHWNEFSLEGAALGIGSKMTVSAEGALETGAKGQWSRAQINGALGNAPGLSEALARRR